MGNKTSQEYNEELESQFQVELKRMAEIQRPAKVSLQEFLESSAKFPAKLPTMGAAMLVIGGEDIMDVEDARDYYREPGLFPVESTRMKTHLKV